MKRLRLWQWIAIAATTLILFAGAFALGFQLQAFSRAGVSSASKLTARVENVKAATPAPINTVTPPVARQSPRPIASQAPAPLAPVEPPAAAPQPTAASPVCPSGSLDTVVVVDDFSPWLDVDGNVESYSAIVSGFVRNNTTDVVQIAWPVGVWGTDASGQLLVPVPTDWTSGNPSALGVQVTAGFSGRVDDIDPATAETITRWQSNSATHLLVTWLDAAPIGCSQRVVAQDKTQ